MNNATINSPPLTLRRLLGDRRISYRKLLWSPITAFALALTLSLLPSAPVIAQASGTKSASDQKGKARRAGLKKKTRKSAKGSALGNRKAQNQRNERDRAETDTSDHAGELDDSEVESGENEPYGANQNGAAEHEAKSINDALKQGTAQRSNRMEFDARLVYGETAGSGAVILFERGQRQLPPLTKQRTKFLAATTEPVLRKNARLRYADQDDNKENKPDKTEKKSTIDGLGN
jgi:hypothetical protein